MIDLDRPCLHANFAANVYVARIVGDGQPEDATTPATAFAAEIKVECADCPGGALAAGNLEVARRAPAAPVPVPVPEVTAEPA